MTTAQLGRRIGVTQPRAVQIEQAERSGSISLNSLERAAEALGCRLVYALVPLDSLEAQVQDRARTMASKRLSSVSHSMALENQSVEQEDEQVQLQSVIEKLVNAPGSKLWDEP